MQKIYPKSFLGIAVLFFFSSYGQKNDEVHQQLQEREIQAFRNKINQYEQQQKNEVQRLKSLGYKEFISEAYK